MNRAYLVWYDNCEPYEDNYTSVQRVFPSWREAESYLESHEWLKKEESITIAFDSKTSSTIRIKSPYWYVEDEYGQKRKYYIEIWDLDTGEKVPYDSKHIFKVIKENQ